MERLNNKEYALVPGTFSIVLPYQVHSITSSTAEPLSFFVVGISLETCLGLSSFWTGFESMILSSEQDVPSHFTFSPAEAEKVSELLFDAHRDFEGKDSWSQLMVKTRLIQALILFDKARNNAASAGSQPSEKSTGTASKDKRVFWDMVNHIQQHHEQPITLQELSYRFGLSRSYIIHCFKKNSGCTFLEYINHVRIHKACLLLVSTDLSIMDIAFEAGFESYATFSRLFNKLKGMSAKTYRQGFGG